MIDRHFRLYKDTQAETGKQNKTIKKTNRKKKKRRIIVGNIHLA